MRSSVTKPGCVPGAMPGAWAAAGPPPASAAATTRPMGARTGRLGIRLLRPRRPKRRRGLLLVLLVSGSRARVVDPAVARLAGGAEVDVQKARARVEPHAHAAPGQGDGEAVDLGPGHAL